MHCFILGIRVRGQQHQKLFSILSFSGFTSNLCYLPSGPKELTGAVDLVQYYKLFLHYEFFCKKSTSLSVLDAHYLHNVFGDKEIRKCEGMQLNQLINDNKSISQEAMHPFDLNALGDAFHLRETAPIELPDSKKGVPTQAGRSMCELKGKEKKDKKHKDKEHKKHKHHHHHKDKKNENDKINPRDSGAEHLKKPHEKKRKVDGDEDLSGIHRHQNTKYKRSKMDEFGVIRIAT
ncbi:mediator of RNA polymerase II transcription subunit 19a-like [Helianthus annuus]|uniref:mediator of RNA polymerase II transcription subunit 19a-like n=1 Tax=Helianthus annuus TaxID=4232 RepID=UPI001652EEB1|nr:mediator of RNA polymerase II transcription subunit 19a-like [Helianthus annuus]